MVIRIVGYNLSHDSSVALVEDGRVVAALALERVTRVKKGVVPAHAFAGEIAKLTDRILSPWGLTPDDVNYWIASSTETTNEDEERELLPSIGRMLPKERMLFMPHPGHHLAHAASAFYSSGFEDATVVVIDAYGSRTGVEREQESVYHFAVGSDPIIKVQNRKTGARIAGTLLRDGRFAFPNNLSGVGEVYRVVTLALGFAEKGSSYDDAGKTMGLAPYGNRISETPLFMSYENGKFSFEQAMDTLRELRLVEQTSDEQSVTTIKKDLRFSREDIAAQLQTEFEEACLAFCRDAIAVCGSRRLAASGGCFLNSVLNTRLMKETDIKDLFVFPAATDDGNAVGAAMYAYHHLAKEVTSKPIAAERIRHVYWGGQTEPSSTSAVLQGQNLQFVDHGTNDIAARKAAEAISNGDIIGWMQGRSEFGPRALGARSILCHPGIPGMKDKLNSRVKFREPFRPFAASVLLEQSHNWFDMPDCQSPFMLYVCQVLPDTSHLISQIVHVDGSCRLQTVSSSQASPYRKLIEEFNGISGIPLVLNTSLNLRGMPIVESVTDALDCLWGSRLDRIFIERFEIFAPNFPELVPTSMVSGLNVAGAESIGSISKFLAFADGNRTLSEIAALSDLPLDVTIDGILDLRRLGFIEWANGAQRVRPKFLSAQYQPSIEG